MIVRLPYTMKPWDRLLWDSAAEGTYRQPDNNRRLRRQAVKDFGVRQLKRAIYRQRHEGYANA